MYRHLPWAIGHHRILCSTPLIQDILHITVHHWLTSLTTPHTLDLTIFQSVHLVTAPTLHSHLAMRLLVSIVDYLLSSSFNGRIKVCAGCKGPHLKGPNNELLPPPNNICIQHSEPLTFTNPRTGLEASKVGNAYYHINSACIHKKHPNFTASLVSCPEEVLKLMQPSHFKLLHDTLHFVMPCSTVTAFHAHCLPLTLYHLCYHLLIVLIICYPFYITAHAQ